jgi:molecular chaperone DnaK
MANTVNFGIDLGTTNSCIAKYDQGKVEVFKNPIGHKETLPSVVAFRKQRIIVGEKAKDYLEKDPHNVVGSFKRKMGTSETFHIESLDENKTPIELSAQVLKELKTFVYTGEQVDAAVITIPASFDTIQSNATKKAGFQAGFSEVFLLQEPIAASLAYANKEDDNDIEEGQWLVYDLGGGTFDVALVMIKDGEMKVVDHQGDNFLGGLDFDNRIIEKIVIPHLEKEGKFENLEQELKSANGRYNKLYYELLNKAEEVKVNLSGHEQTEIEFEVEDMSGELLDIYFTITRADFENAIEDQIQVTIDMISTIMERNNVTKDDANYILMIGGSTYIPRVRGMINEQLSITVNCNIDPTTAVAMGAAYFAGTKTMSQPVEETEQEEGALESNIVITTAYQKATQEEEEYFTAKVEGDFKGMFYRIQRDDGGFDSGLKDLKERITEDLPLNKNAYNYFTLKVYDGKNNPIKATVPKIEIVHGKFNVLGQPLPNDICIEVDDHDNQTTKLEVIFEKNSILPLKRTITREITKTISKNSSDSVIINILEGPKFATPSSNNSIGSIEIKAEDLERDLVKGSDIEIILEMSEDRDLKIVTYLMMTDQEFSNLFSPSERHVNINRLNDEINELQRRLSKEIRTAEKNEDYETAASLQMLEVELNDVANSAQKVSADDVTDNKYQLEDRKRHIAFRIDDLTKDKKITEVMTDYISAKRECEWLVKDEGSESEQKEFENIIAKEKQYISAGSPTMMRELLEKLYSLSWKINWRRPAYVISLYRYYSIAKYEEYPDKNKANRYIEAGERALDRQNYDELRVIINQLYSLLPEDRKDQMLNQTGIG